nr:ankyrin repeat domain-containing protein [Rickettsia montanensis]
MLHKLISFNSIDKMEFLLQNATNTDLEIKNHYGFTPLYSSVFDENIKAAELLLKNGADANFGFTPLTSIMQSQTITPIEKQELIEQGHDVNAKDEKGNTALFYASTKEIAKILLQPGSEIDTVDNYGSTPFFYLLLKHESGQNKTLLDFFLNNNVNLNINACGESIFNHALTSRDKWLLEKLISKGADIGQGVLLRNPFDHSIAGLVKIGVDKEKIVYA